MKDISNIYKLSDDEFKEIKKNLFEDCVPGLEEYAEQLKTYIKNSETPFVITLEAGYGMGKTHFATRFTEYLKRDKIEAIYFSAWENDYLPDPFLSFSKAILLHFHKNKEILKKLKDIFIGISKATSVSTEIGVPLVGKVEVNFDLEKLITHIENTNYTDDIQNFKKELKETIQTLKDKKLVIVVDELDRCRPDYAMKVFETIKHFFDIEGLFIILPIGKEALSLITKSFYNFDSTYTGEEYIKKFINDNKVIPEPNYRKFVENYINNKTFLEEIKLGKLNAIGKDFSTIKNLQNGLILRLHTNKLTLREIKNLIINIKNFCRNINNNTPIRCTTLVYFYFIKNINETNQHSYENFNIIEIFKVINNYILEVEEAYKLDKTLNKYNPQTGIYIQKAKEEFNKIKTYEDISNISNILYALHSNYADTNTMPEYEKYKI